MVVRAPLAHAATFTAFTCHTPSGQPIGASGWTEGEVAPGYFISSTLTCSTPTSAISSQVGPGPAYTNGQGAQLTYQTPAGETITSYALNLSAYAASCPQNGGGCTGGVGEAWVVHTGDSDPNYDFRILGGGAWGPATIAESGLQNTTYVATNTSCDTYPNLSTWTCPAGEEVASIAISSGTSRSSTAPLRRSQTSAAR